MQSVTSTSTHQAASITSLKPAYHRRQRPYGTDLQDANAAGRPFSFVPKRRISSGHANGVTQNEEGTMSPCSQQQAPTSSLVGEPASKDTEKKEQTPEATPRLFYTFPSTKPEATRGRIPSFGGEQANSLLSNAPAPPATSLRLDFERTYTSPTASIQTGDITPAAAARNHSTPTSPTDFLPLGLIRKKSGELVKPSLKSSGFATWALSSPGRGRTKSAPTTPIGPKFVHFDAQLEHVKLFLAEQKPLAVSRDGSPTETSEGETTDPGYPFPSMTLRIKPVALPSLPQEPWTFDVKLERVALEDSALVGHILVRNISFAKWVAVRFTLDSWQTTSEVTARHVTSLHSYTFDRFEFRVRLGDYLNGIESKRLVLCVRFSVEGCEMWDSNGGRNYEVGFERVKKDHVRMATVPSASGSKPGPPLVSDLRDELEKVAQEKHANSSVTIVKERHRKKTRGLRVWLGNRILGDEEEDSPTLHSHSALEDSNKPAASSLRNADAPLSSRYDFGASLRGPTWTPPSQIRSLPLYKSKPTCQRPKSPSLPDTPISEPSIQFPDAGRHKRSMTIPLDNGSMFSPPLTLPRGSPRDFADYADESVKEHRRLTLGDNESDRGRHHTRGWAQSSSYFDRVTSDAPALKKTPPSTPRVIPPTPARRGTRFHLGSEESSDSSLSESSTTPRTSPNSEWTTLRRLDDDSVSTPSITTSMSTPATLSPSLPQEHIPRAASDDNLAIGAIAGMSRAKRPHINSTPYYSFLDQFCFFTGVGAHHNHSHSINMDSNPPRRAHSVSRVEDYFPLTRLNDSPHSPHSPIATISPGATPIRSHIATDFTPREFTSACTDFPMSTLSTPIAG